MMMRGFASQRGKALVEPNRRNGLLFCVKREEIDLEHQVVG
jgi:hypothetical protein